MKQCNWSGRAERGLAPVLENTEAVRIWLRSRVIGARTPIMHKQQASGGSVASYTETTNRTRATKTATLCLPPWATRRPRVWSAYLSTGLFIASATSLALSPPNFSSGSAPSSIIASQTRDIFRKCNSFSIGPGQTFAKVFLKVAVG